MCGTSDGDPDLDTGIVTGTTGAGTGTSVGIGTGSGSGTGEESVDDAERAQFSALLEDSAEDLYEHAPCGYLSTLLDGQIAKVNATLLAWLGYTRAQLVGRRRFADLLTVGGKLYHETHFAPLLAMQGRLSGIALELKCADGSRLPVLVTSVVKTGTDGEPLLIRTTVFDARDRRAYEKELLRARKQAEQAGEDAEQARAEAETAHQGVEAERARLQRVVSILQKSLLPPELPRMPGLDAAAYYHPASVDVIGGDFYDLFPLDKGRWGFFLGDVCGKGPEAAAVTSLIRYTLRAAFLVDSDPVHTLATLNAALHERFTGSDPRYCTAIAGTLTPGGEAGAVTVGLAGGGHPPALLLRADGTADFLPTPGGMLLGVLADPQLTSATTLLRPGDTMLLYTDGLTEARTRSGPRYSEEDLHAFVADLAPAGAQTTVDAVQRLLGGFGEGLDDDTALLALGVPAARTAAANPGAAR
ncbi:PP2C family protein-serine/threonine phosphatase [Actinacidiphila paucisporea]|uniref:Sigma-B regulation protein RsbU (Phosphoserine phosphatase) n=1 Tax=Actinacidiphila paucisporea TaxID=310782 RepID=A0A1M7I816_9ACTN|nr:SpoIIE family protein phosphatase [Actinacidiphila paucisporea]SHM36870.1 sigma-B regulation protein RsbU (phosphoserine phosphatase) [Actinacidiphila paucisporea]